MELGRLRALRLHACVRAAVPAHIFTQTKQRKESVVNSQNHSRIVCSARILKTCAHAEARLQRNQFEGGHLYTVRN